MAERWLLDEFDTYELVQAVDDLDSIRGIMADGPNCEPPQLRNDLMKLHGLAMQACHETGEGDKAMAAKFGNLGVRFWDLKVG